MSIARTLALILVLGLNGALHAQDGVPDLAWGTMGGAQTYFCGICRSGSSGGIMFDDQGRVLISGWVSEGLLPPSSVYAVRYTTDGQVDSTFGEYGVAEGTFCTSDDVVKDMDIGPDGSIYICGYEDWGLSLQPDPIAVLRWTEDGQIDETFGRAGVRAMLLGEYTRANTMVALPDGKVLLGGTYCGTSGDFCPMVLIRLTHDGALDTTFGPGTGWIDHQYWTGNASISELMPQPDGRFLAVGYGGPNIYVLRFLSDGTLDSTFDTDGMLPLAAQANTQDGDIHLSADGRITVFIRQAASHRIFRFWPDGSPDLSYGVGGVAEIPNTLVGGQFSAMLPDGRVLLSRGNPNVRGILCVANDGTIDADFGVDGYALPVLGDQWGYAGALAVGPDQRFVSATTAPSQHWAAETWDMAAYMFLADSVADQTVAIEVTERSAPALFPSPYSGGALWLSVSPALRTMRWTIVDDSGRDVRDLPYTPASAAVAVDISPYVADLAPGCYLLCGTGTTGERSAQRFMVMH